MVGCCSNDICVAQARNKHGSIRQAEANSLHPEQAGA